MKTNKGAIEMNSDLSNRRLAIEKIAFTVEGVVAVNIGISKQETPIIKILVDRQLNKISRPELLIAPDIEWQYIGEIDIQ